MAAYGAFQVPPIENEEVKSFAPNSGERTALAAALTSLESQLPIRIPLVIGGSRVFTEATVPTVNPAKHSQVVCQTSQASKEHVAQAIVAGQVAKRKWESAPLSVRSAVFLKAAELIATKYRYELLAATMVGQGKNIYQAEIDAAAELVDFLRFNCRYAEDLYGQQPAKSAAGVWNRAEYRALEGFVYAITPFNFTAIAGNLVAAPALMGNTVVWKPSPYAVLSNYLLYNIFVEAGLPDGVVSFVPGDAETVTAEVLSARSFGALHFTGSTAVFEHLYRTIAANLPKYRSFPRIVGESGGKNFHLVHASADATSAAKATVRGAFEYQGQKCSATSRAYVAASIWPEFRDVLVRETNALTVGPPTDLTPFVGPVIHEHAFSKLKAVLAGLAADQSVEVLAGGTADGAVGYYVMPTVVVASDPEHDVFCREFFGPVLAVYVYADDEYEAVMDAIDLATDYALTGSVFARSRDAIEVASRKLRNAAGNFYINDKSTGAVVGQQWFGGARRSGTNDKSGSGNILSRFVSVRNIKETFYDTTRVTYPSNDD
ncbi:Aldehyde/histidinol dehydrogenase [Lipomyces orientalis]|uniref:Aldehyde/histidinol dehydrogenase n=1 Tax=Lipomyces orientalis TaxID=1233043 RepID=A0ACC3THZ4_9ASCO